MAIVNTLKTLFPTRGVPTEYVALLAQALTRNATTTFAFTGFRNPIRTGAIRLKTIDPPVAATQITAIKITATDGTLTETLYQDAIARTAAEDEDLLFNFLSDLNLTTVNLIITMANAGAADQTADMELVGNP